MKKKENKQHFQLVIPKDARLVSLGGFPFVANTGCFEELVDETEATRPQAVQSPDPETSRES